MSNFIVSRAGVKVPAILYGTAWKKEQTEALVTQALDSGFRAIDTANQYKHYAEKFVGDALNKIDALNLKKKPSWNLRTIFFIIVFKFFY